jgi:molybdopterin-guanine dinucleotide biosynthesis protein A
MSAPGGGRIIGLVLAGGQSRRFGRDKAFVTLGGRSLLERSLESLRPHVDELWLAAKSPGYYSGDSLRVLADRYETSTPLSGILTAAAEMNPEDWLFLTACDIVLLDTTLPGRLTAVLSEESAARRAQAAEISGQDNAGRDNAGQNEARQQGLPGGRAVLYSVEGRPQPFPGIYPAPLMRIFEEALEEGRRELIPILSRMPRREVPLESDGVGWLCSGSGSGIEFPPLVNINRPEDLAQLETMLYHREREYP